MGGRATSTNAAGSLDRLLLAVACVILACAGASRTCQDDNAGLQGYVGYYGPATGDNWTSCADAAFRPNSPICVGISSTRPVLVGETFCPRTCQLCGNEGQCGDAQVVLMPRQRSLISTSILRARIGDLLGRDAECSRFCAGLDDSPGSCTRNDCGSITTAPNCPAPRWSYLPMANASAETAIIERILADGSSFNRTFPSKLMLLVEPFSPRKKYQQLLEQDVAIVWLGDVDSPEMLATGGYMSYPHLKAAKAAGSAEFDNNSGGTYTGPPTNWFVGACNPNQPPSLAISTNQKPMDYGSFLGSGLIQPAGHLENPCFSEVGIGAQPFQDAEITKFHALCLLSELSRRIDLVYVMTANSSLASARAAYFQGLFTNPGPGLCDAAEQAISFDGLAIVPPEPDWTNSDQDDDHVEYIPTQVRSCYVAPDGEDPGVDFMDTACNASNVDAIKMALTHRIGDQLSVLDTGSQVLGDVVFVVDNDGLAIILSQVIRDLYPGGVPDYIQIMGSGGQLYMQHAVNGGDVDFSVEFGEHRTNSAFFKTVQLLVSFWAKNGHIKALGAPQLGRGVHSPAGRYLSAEISTLMYQGERYLQNILLDDYAADVRPGQDNISIALGMTILSYSEIDESTQTVKLVLEMDEIWLDNRLGWLDTVPNYLSSLRIQAGENDQVWAPNGYFVDMHEMKTIKEAHWIFPGLSTEGGYVRRNTQLEVQLYCRMNLGAYPFDVQTCPIKYRYNDFAMDVIDLDGGQGHGLGTSSSDAAERPPSTTVSVRDDCAEGFNTPKLTFNYITLVEGSVDSTEDPQAGLDVIVRLERDAGGAWYGAIGMQMLITGLALFQFYLPPGSVPARAAFMLLSVLSTINSPAGRIPFSGHCWLRTYWFVNLAYILVCAAFSLVAIDSQLEGLVIKGKEYKSIKKCVWHNLHAAKHRQNKMIAKSTRKNAGSSNPLIIGPGFGSKQSQKLGSHGSSDDDNERRGGSGRAPRDDAAGATLDGPEARPPSPPNNSEGSVRFSDGADDITERQREGPRRAKKGGGVKFSDESSEEAATSAKQGSARFADDDVVVEIVGGLSGPRREGADDGAPSVEMTETKLGGDAVRVADESREARENSELAERLRVATSSDAIDELDVHHGEEEEAAQRDASKARRRRRSTHFGGVRKAGKANFGLPAAMQISIWSMGGHDEGQRNESVRITEFLEIIFTRLDSRNGAGQLNLTNICNALSMILPLGLFKREAVEEFAMEHSARFRPPSVQPRDTMLSMSQFVEFCLKTKPKYRDEISDFMLGDVNVQFADRVGRRLLTPIYVIGNAVMISIGMHLW